MDERKRKLEVCISSLMSRIFLIFVQEIRRRASSKIKTDESNVAEAADKIEDDNTQDNADINEKEKKKSIKFRNYKPYDSSLVIKDVEKCKTIEEKTFQVGADAIKDELSSINKDDELNIVPKKLNWDLKSQVSSKIERLEKRTQRAIVEILREKLTTEAANETDNELE